MHNHVHTCTCTSTEWGLGLVEALSVRSGPSNGLEKEEGTRGWRWKEEGERGESIREGRREREDTGNHSKPLLTPSRCGCLPFQMSLAHYHLGTLRSVPSPLGPSPYPPPSFPSCAPCSLEGSGGQIWQHRTGHSPPNSGFGDQPR